MNKNKRINLVYRNTFIFTELSHSFQLPLISFLNTVDLFISNGVTYIKWATRIARILLYLIINIDVTIIDVTYNRKIKLYFHDQVLTI